MIDSSIASSHFYYIELFRLGKEVTKKSLINSLSDQNKYEYIGDEGVVHTQRIFHRFFGSGEALKDNIVPGRRDQCWYDFYLDEIKLNSQNYFYICYPYKEMESFIENLPDIRSKRLFSIPQVKPLLDYIQKPTATSDNSINKEIIKYSAQITDDKNAESVNINGRNPVNSSIYRLLESNASVSVSPLSLKLRFSKEKYLVDFAFDKHGNIKLWVPPKYRLVKSSKVENIDEYEQSLLMIKDLIVFLSDIKALKEGSKKSKRSALEND